VRRFVIAVVELVILTVLILATRFANYQDVFIGGEIYFTDADCYARMTRVRMCLEKPGQIIRQHSFENFPEGTSPHTTAPFDYLIAALSVALGPFTTQARDLAGAIVSPLLALLTAWFLWWWSRQVRLPYRAVLLILFSISPILAHGTELGRPDHQSLLLALITVALCAEWSLSVYDQSRGWSLASGTAWGLALWVSLYEPLILLAVLCLTQMVVARKTFFARTRVAGWATGGAILLLALVLEQRLPGLPSQTRIFSGWASTVGELSPVPIGDPLWFRWLGLLLIPLPALLWFALRRTRAVQTALVAVLLASFGLTVWQARWGYFTALVFALVLPACLSLVRFRVAGYLLFAISCWPILKDWDERLWPNEFQAALAAERRMEGVGWRTIAKEIDGPFIASWWWSPAVAYWSRQPGVAGSSHEALPGIERSARFFLATDADAADAIVREAKVVWVVAYDAERTTTNSAAILGVPPPENALASVLDRRPSQAPAFLELATQNSAAKLFRVRFFPKK
jgi:hypothetical protein